MPHSDAAENVTPALDFPSRDGLVVNDIRVDYEPPGAVHSVSRNASQELPARLIPFCGLEDGECTTAYDRE